MNDEQKNQKNVKENTRRKRLYRSRRERMIGGVCGGAAKYFGIDPTFLRVAFVVLSFVGGWGVIAYIVGLIVIPENSEQDREEKVEGETQGGNAGLIWGSVFILAGFIFLLHNFGWIPWPMWKFWQLSWKFLWPFLLICIGLVLLLMRSTHKGSETEGDGASSKDDVRKLMRSRKERMIGGVCGGLARYFRIDPTLVRLLWAFGTIVSHGLGLIAYIILLIVLQEEESQSTSAETNGEVQQ